MSESLRDVLPALRGAVPTGSWLSAWRLSEGDAPEVPLSQLSSAQGMERVRLGALGVFQRLVPHGPGRLSGRVALVTGAAQGFGLGIAGVLAEEGAWVVIADANREGAIAAARHLGASRAEAVACDVGDATSVRQAVNQVVEWFGGVDLLVANAGVLRAGGLEELTEQEFDLVTRVNYRGYYLCVREVAPVMATQHQARPDAWFDIVQVNSKSGLEGSKLNFAYSGSKFGAVGLTQSFALELVDQGIKVNAVCPGNYFEGPLWSDPENGLFVQYLEAGKVPGATSIEDVRRFYESKVPMGRGCGVEDVARAVLYLVEQRYETGQALPVTGGQVMLG